MIAHYEEVIRGRGDASIIMGHSFGGAITQILLDRGTTDKNKAIALTPRTPAVSSAGSRRRSSTVTVLGPGRYYVAGLPLARPRWQQHLSDMIQTPSSF